MNKILVFFFFLVFSNHYNLAQTISTAQSGAWNDTNTWSGGTIPTDANSTAININHSVNIPNGFTASADQITATGSTLTVDAGGVLQLQNSGGTDLSLLDDLGLFIGSSLVVNGTFTNNSTAAINVNSFSTIAFNANSTYQHNIDDGQLPSTNTTWNATSTCEITGYVSTVPTNLNQTFGNFIWNSAGQGAGNALINLTTATINGNLEVSNTGASNGLVTLATSDGTVNVSGDFIVSGSSRIALTISNTVTFDVGGDFNFSSSGLLSVLVSTGGNTTFNLNGDLTFTSGTLSAPAGNAVFTFDGSSVQTLTSGGTFSGNVDFVVSGTSTLDIPSTNVLSGGGASSDFTLNSGATLRVGSTAASGAIQPGSSGGNIQVGGTRTYNSGSTIIYNGSGAQFIGTGHPSNVATTINNSNGVTLASDVSIGGALTLTSGNLTVGANQLTLQSTLTPNSNFINVSSTSDIVVNGSGAFGTFPFNGSQTINNFTFDRAGQTVVFNNNMVINGALTLTNGDLNFSGNSLTLNGTITGAGDLISNSSSTLIAAGSGALGTLRFDAIGGNTLGTLTVNRTGSGSVVSGGTLNIATVLNLSNGTFNNIGQSLIMANGSTLTKNSNGTFSGNRPETTSGSYSIEYTGSTQTTGNEVPAELDELNNLTVNGGPVTLGQSIQVNGDVTLTSGSLEIGANNLTVTGNWIRNSGSLSVYTGQVIFAGTTTFSGTNTPSFTNIQVNAGASVTLPSNNINVNGNIQFDPSATINANGGTLILGTTSNQNLTTGGATLNNVDVNKASGTVTIASTLNLAGEMTFLNTSTSTVASGGNLVVVSTSDGTSNNGSIGVIPSGVSITGDVTVQRFMSGESRIFRYLSSPVSNASFEQWRDDFPITGTFSDPSTGAGIISANPSLFRYNESLPGLAGDGWEAYPTSGNLSASTIEVGRGYAAFIREGSASTTVDVTGTLNVANNTDIDLNVTYNDDGNGVANEGWNLVGNPFPSTIDWDLVLSATGGTRTNVNNGIQVRDNGAGGVYRTYDGTSGDLTGGLIATGQAFWVQANAASPVLTLNEQAKSSSTGTFYRTKSEDPEVIQIQLSDGIYSDNAFVSFLENATVGFDENQDTPNLDNVIFDVTTFGSDSVDLAINYIEQLSCSEVVALNIADVESGVMTLEFLKLESLGESYNITLNDKYTNTTQNIISEPTYSFEVDENNNNTFGKGRLELLITKEVDILELIITLEDGFLKSNYTSGNQWLFNGQPIEGASSQSIPADMSGTYTLEVTLNGCTSSVSREFLITGLENSFDKYVHLFPNPTSDQLVLEFLNQVDFVQLNLVDLSGKNVLAMDIRDEKHRLILPIANIKSGIYLLSLLSEDGIIYKRIIKN